MRGPHPQSHATLQFNIVVTRQIKNVVIPLSHGLWTPNFAARRLRIQTLSDFHKMIVTSLKAHFKKLPPKKIVYRDYKNFDENAFLYELDQNMIKGKFYAQNDPYNGFTNTFTNVANKHAPLKKKIIRGNDARFMTKELRKAIMNRSRSKHKYLKNPSRENFLILKKMKNKSNSLCRKAKKQFFK